MEYITFTFELCGYPFRIRDIASSRTIYTVSEELEEDVYGLERIHLGKEDTFIDVGANVGLVSIYVKKKFGCKVIAFEPVAENIENFKHNILLNGLELSDFEIHHKAVSNTDNKTVDIAVSSTDMGGSGLYFYDKTYIEKVETTTLGKYLTKDVKYLKVDCEMSEYDIIPNIKNSLQDVKYIGIEFHRANCNQNPVELYKQIRETFEGELYPSYWDFLDSTDSKNAIEKEEYNRQLKNKK